MQVAARYLAPRQRHVQRLALQRRRPLARDQRLPPLFEQALQRDLDLVRRLPDELALLAGQLAQSLEDRAQFAALASQVACAPVLQRLGRLDALKLRRCACA